MRRLLAAAAVLLAVLALAGCAGVRSGEQPAAAAGRPPGADEVRLVVSRDFGATTLVDVTAAAADKLTVMALLATYAKVDTQYGGGFVKAIDGLSSTYGTVSDAQAQDWFYWVDGVMADVGAGEHLLRGGETVWWDYHAWAEAMYLPATVAAFPVPWTRRESPLTTNDPSAALDEWAANSGLRLTSPQPLADVPPAAGIVVATAAEATATPWLRSRIAGKDGGVALVDVEGGAIALRALDGTSGPTAAGACLALPNPEDGGSPLLLLLVQTPEQLPTLLSHVTPGAASARVGLAVVGDSAVPLPWSSP